MKVRASINAGISVKETVESTDDPLVDTTNPYVSTKLLAQLTWDSTTTPATALYAEQVHTLSGGALVVDFTSLLYRGKSVSFSGKKVLAIVFYAPTGNAGKITITPDATSGLTLFGTAFSIDVPVGGYQVYVPGSNGPSVDATHKRIDLAGTGTDTLRMIAIAG